MPPPADTDADADLSAGVEHDQDPSARLEAAIDGLYGLGLDGFVGKRNALAKQLKDAGDAPAAKRVRACKKPSLSAWAVNQLWWDENDTFTELLTASHHVGRAQATGAGPAERAEAETARKHALRRLMERANSLLQEQGHATSASTLRRISTTVEAVAAQDLEALERPPGRLVEDLDPPGFDLLSALSSSMASAPRSPLRPPPAIARPDPSAQARAAAAQAREQTLQALRRSDAAQRRLDTARADQEQASERLELARAELESARQRVERLEAEERVAARDVSERLEELDHAQAAGTRARQAQAEAQRVLEEFEGS